MKRDFNIKKMNIAIVGLGLMGGSFAKALKSFQPKNLWAVDIDRQALDKGQALSIIDKGFTEAEYPLKNSDLVIICLYPKLVEEFVRENRKNFKENAIITDVTGVKEGLIEEINKFLPKEVDFVFGHPMAGRENGGLDYSSAKVFKGANYIISPNPRNKDENINFIKELATNIGFGKIIELTPKKHDEVIAFTSQLPHVLAVSLVNSDNLNIDTGAVVGDSYRELTRIAQINGELWTELFIENKENLIEKIEDLESSMKSMKKAIQEEDRASLKEQFRQASRRRKKL